MTLETKYKEVLKFLMKGHSYTSMKDLEKYFQVSRRTLYYYFEQINNWLIDHGQREILRIRGKGYSLDEDTVSYLRSMFSKETEQVFYSKEERIATIFTAICLLKQFEFTVDEIAEFFQVSKNTIFNDLNELKEQVGEKQVKIRFHKRKGYYVEGAERQIRNLLYQFIQSEKEFDLVFGIELFPPTLKERIEQELCKLENYLDVSFVDSTLMLLSKQLMILVQRASQGQYIELDEVERKTLEETPEYLGVTQLAEWLNQEFSLSLPKSECAYLTILVLATKLNRKAEIAPMCENLTLLDDVVNKMIREFEIKACISFVDEQVLKDNLFLHLKPAFYRLKYGIAVQNPLSDRIKDQYRDVYQITQRVSHHFTELVGEKLPEGEVAYIAVHFGAWVQRSKNQMAREKRILLVCPEGIGVSRILENQLLGLFAGMNISIEVMSMRNYNRISIVPGDLILSTVFLADKNVPVYLVNSILSEDEKQKLLKYIFRFFAIEEEAPRMKTIIDIIAKHADIRNEEELVCELTEHFIKPGNIMKEEQPVLKELITPERIQIVEGVENWQESIRVAAQPLIKDGCIEPRYVDAMIESIKKLGPYIVIGPNIGIPHARPDEGVLRTGMSFLKLKKAVAFSESEKHNVELMFVLASKDNVEHMRALRQLTRMLAKQENVERLRGDIDQKEIIEMIEVVSEVE